MTIEAYRRQGADVSTANHSGRSFDLALNPDEFLGQWVVLSFVPALGEFDSAL